MSIYSTFEDAGFSVILSEEDTEAQPDRVRVTLRDPERTYAEGGGHILVASVLTANTEQGRAMTLSYWGDEETAPAANLDDWKKQLGLAETFYGLKSGVLYGALPGMQVDGENITINMTKDEGMQRYIQFVQKLIDEDLVDAKTPNWSDDWNRELNDGTLASLTIGAWMPINLMTGAPDQAGNWRVAQLPQWEEGKEVSAEDGGSALAVTSQSKNQAAAYKLVEYMTHGEGAQTMADTGTFPSLKKILRSDSFTDPTTESNKKTNDYFGGQNVNEVLSAAAQRPTEKFQYLPYNPYAQTAYGDEVSKAYSGDITLEKALENYANKLAEQGKQQGYNVTVK